jgi:hypothetical protein
VIYLIYMIRLIIIHGFFVNKKSLPAPDGFVASLLPMTDPQKSPDNVASRRDASPPWLIDALQNGRARSSKGAILAECKGRRCAVLPGDASLRDATGTRNAAHAAAGTRMLRVAPDGFVASFLPMTDPQKSPGNVASRRDASLGRKAVPPPVASRRNASPPWQRCIPEGCVAR